MTKSNMKVQNQVQIPTIPEFVKSQIQQSLESYRSNLSVLVQMLTVLIVGNVTVVGFALNRQSSGIFLVGVVFPIIAFYLIHKINAMLIPALFTAVTLEQKYGGKTDNWLASTILSAGLSPEAMEEMMEIANITDYNSRMRKLRKASVPPFRKGIGLVRFSLLLIAIGQIVSPFLLTLLFGWKLF
jgi:hypothetical protein